MSAHTPGPWRIGDAGATVFGPPNGTPAPKVICTLTHSMATYSKRADARLIAAAPELLAVLQATLPALIRLGDFIGNVDNADVHPRGTGIDRCKLIEQVRAAIAKAEGK